MELALVMLSGRDIPQLNRINVVVELVRGCVEGAVAVLPPRQRSYAQQAARILALLDDEGRPTVRGVALAAAPANGVLPLLRDAFAQSRVGAAWMAHLGVVSLSEVRPDTAQRFLQARSDLAESTARRRASTLRQWLEDLVPQGAADAEPDDAQQLTLTAWRPREPEPDFPWPDARLVPHNEGTDRVRAVLDADFEAAPEVLVLTGYAALQEVVGLLARAPDGQQIRLLFGHEPYATDRDRYTFDGHTLADEVRDYWLREMVSVEESSAVLAALARVDAGHVEVRLGGRKPVHAKMYVTPAAVTLGSSNFTRPGLSSQTEANTRLTKGRSAAAARQLAEGIWTLGHDWTEGFVALLHELLQAVSWTEALARGCAVVLEGAWARRYLPARLAADQPLWPHQVQGVTEALHILLDVGSVLIADATGSGKTRMGAWTLRGLRDHLLRTGAAERAGQLPAVITPPAVVRNWQSALLEVELPWQAWSHGPLSNPSSNRHGDLVQTLRRAGLLVVDEAHNFLNRSSRTRRLQLHLADHVVLFTATPINRGPGDLLSLVELLGPDNFDDEALDALVRLARYRSSGQSMAEAPELPLLKERIQRFMVRRTRSQLNAIAATHAEAYQGDVKPRYPRHTAQFYPLPMSDSDRRLVQAIDAEARALKGLIRIGKELRLSAWQKAQGMGEDKVLRMRLSSAAALARYTVLERLRSSRLALVEHAVGTQVAVERLAPDLSVSDSRSQGDTARTTRELAGNVPKWSLSEETRALAPTWLLDEQEHRAACEHEAARYDRIAALALQMSGAREQRKVETLRELVARHGRVLAYDGAILSLFYFRDALSKAGVPAACFTGEGGRAAKKRARKTFGRDGLAAQAIALCTDAFAEGMNLQGASCVVHLDTPTVIRTAEQRAGRVDRMDSLHQAIEVWWPKDPPELAPRRKELIRERHEVVVDLIGANLKLPGEDTTVEVEDLARQAAELADADLDGLFDAFRPVRQVRDTLLPPGLYERMRTSQADVVASVSAVEADTPWAWLAVGARDRAAPRWVFFAGPHAKPQVDFGPIAVSMRLRLGPEVPARGYDAVAAEWLAHFIARLGRCEDALLPPRRRRSLKLARAVWSAWSERAWNTGDKPRRALLEGLLKAVDLDGTQLRPDPRELADAWLALLRPYRREALETRRRGSRPLTISDLESELVKKPIETERLRQAFATVPSLSPVGKRVVAAIVGVPAT